MSHRVCPVWIGYLLASPLRKLFQDPIKILAPHIKEGMVVLDVGCAMGFFSLPLATLVGASGKVISLDMQEKMLAVLRTRALKKGVADRIDVRCCQAQSLGLSDLTEKIDFALTFAMVHEVPDPGRLLEEIHASLRPGGQLLVAEPTGHVSSNDFETTLTLAQKIGFTIAATPPIRRSLTALLQKGAK